MRARRAARPALAPPPHLLDPGGLIPVDPDRVTALLAYLDEADPEHLQHDPLALLIHRPGARLVDHLGPEHRVRS